MYSCYLCPNSFIMGTGIPTGVNYPLRNRDGKKRVPENVDGTGMRNPLCGDGDWEPSPDGEFPIAISNSSAILSFVYCMKTNQLTHVKAKKDMWRLLGGPILRGL
jgi:hypothetical protein